MVLSVIIIACLLVKIRLLYKKLKYVDEADKWHRLAITDDLTGLYNRNAYNNEILKMKEDSSQRSYGIILFDVDNFKLINDTKGHLAGDIVLKDVANILLEIFSGPRYSLFRIGGDEFLVLSKDVSENEIIERLIALKRRLDLDENISLSKGYSIIKDNVEEAFKYADDMLYADKLSKNNRSSAAEII